ncbi:MAG: hypothetical protein ACYDBJ_00295 [Aggregatilineales bacterium]
MPWVYDPHSGGKKIPPAVQDRTRQRILAYAQAHYAGKYTRIEVRFKAQFCYIDAYTEPYVAPDFPPPGFTETREEFIERLRKTPTHLCRLRYFGDEESWSLAFYTYSHETYEPNFSIMGHLRAHRKKALPHRRSICEANRDGPLY